MNLQCSTNGVKGIGDSPKPEVPNNPQAPQAVEAPNPRAIAILRQARVHIRANGGNRRSCKDALRVYARCCAPELPLLVLKLYLDGGVRALTNSNWEKFRLGFRIEDMAVPA